MTENTENTERLDTTTLAEIQQHAAQNGLNVASNTAALAHLQARVEALEAEDDPDAYDYYLAHGSGDVDERRTEGWAVCRVDEGDYFQMRRPRQDAEAGDKCPTCGKHFADLRKYLNERPECIPF